MKLLPFASVKVCPACGSDVKGFRVKFSTDHVVPAGNGEFVSMQRVGQALAPHLEKQCPKCDYGWLEEVQTQEAKEVANVG